MAQCSAPSCERKVLARALCSMHYARFLNHGTLEVVQRPKISLEERLARVRKQRRASYAKHQDSFRNYRLRKYGLTMTDYHRLLENQGGGCAVCGTKYPGGKYRTFFHVDHDHWAQEIFGWVLVRGLLCHNCNIAAGQVKDDPKIARQLVNYLQNGGE